MTKKICSIILIFCFALSDIAYAAIALGGTIKAANGTSGTTLSTGTLTPSGSDTITVVFVASWTSGGTVSPSGVTCGGGTAMTQALAADASDSMGSWWYKVGCGTGIITATWGSSVTQRVIVGGYYTGVDQTTPLAATTTKRRSSSEANVTSLTLAITTTSDNAMVLGGMINNYGGSTNSTHTIQETDATVIETLIADGIKATAGAVNVTWNRAGGYWFCTNAEMNIALNPASASRRRQGILVVGS